MWNKAPIILGLLFFTKRSQNYHTVFIKRVYYIDNETRGNTSKNNDKPTGQEENEMYKKIYVLDGEGGYFASNEEEMCKIYCNEHGITYHEEYRWFPC